MSKRAVTFSKVMKGLFATLILVLGMGQSIEVEAATTAQKESFKKEMLNMFYTMDSSKHNVSKYKITVNEFDELYEEVQYGEGTEIFGAYYPSTYITYTYSAFGGYLQTIQIKDANADALTRYNEMLPEVEMILQGIEADMSDLDKVIYLHDSVVELVSYGGNTDAKFIASGALGDKKAVCAGYAKALNTLLRRVGLDTTYVKGTSLNHGWSYVKLDGEWYHIDPTWDDTRTPVTGQVSRANLLKNDAEFSNNHGEWILRRVEEASDSTLYENWFVQDIVGKMSFEDGLWYYLDTENQVVMASDSLGEQNEVLFNYADLGKVQLVDAADNQLVLMVNGQELSKSVEEWKQTVEDTQKEDNVVGDNAPGEIITDFSLDLSDISFWRTGHYNPYTGTYGANKFRICTNELIENTQSSYVVRISDEKFKIAIRELNEKSKMISSVELENGDIYVPSEGTVYLAVSIYNCVQEKGNFFSVYEEMFANGFQVGFGSIFEDESNEVPEDDNAAEDNEVAEDDNAAEDNEVTEDGNVAEDNEVAEDGNAAEDNEVAEDDNVAEDNEVAEDDNAAEDNEVAEDDNAAEDNEVAEDDNAAEDNEVAEDDNAAEDNEVAEDGNAAEDSEAAEDEDATGDESANDADGSVTQIGTAGLDLSDISLWRTGHYNPGSGTYAPNKFRICTNDLIENTQDSYIVRISDENFRMAIRELNAGTKMISSVELGNGDVYVPSEGTVYLAISIYNCVQEKGNFFTVYEEMFANGFQVGFGFEMQEKGEETLAE